MRFLSTVLIDALLFMAISGFFPNSLYVASAEVAVIAALVLGVLNWLVKPILVILSLPINLLTLGLFGIVINGAMLELTSGIVGTGFELASFWTAMLIAILMSIVSAIIASYFDRSD
ncbi:phage holin family protein [Lentilactobacillus raoultii]|uniref:Phage holin family protein n=1 Tax=Lentilactobacillus raoultii TaxID=1987503 RepID=A0ABW3PIE5_9LACO|nr:phage holin family protein [Lentilactobacillus raoultii]